MKDQIIARLDNPAELERLYRSNKTVFRQAFRGVYPQISNNTLAAFWQERLFFSSETPVQAERGAIPFLVVAGILAGLLAKLPALLHLNEEVFFSRNIGFLVFPFITAWFAWKNNLGKGKMVLIGGVYLASAVFINCLPQQAKSDTLVLSCIHLLLVLWSMLGFAFNGDWRSFDRRNAYLSFNGDLVVITTLIGIAGALLSAVTIGLFMLIGLDIREFYLQNIVIFVLPSAPLIGAWLIDNNPALVGRISPVIARIFTPLVLVMLVIYLAAIIGSGKDPYNDREFLLLFNVLLVGVMAIIFFSVADISGTGKSSQRFVVLFALCLVTIIINGIALSAILFRISGWGITPNRMAVLGANVLILFNLAMVTGQLFRVLRKKADADAVKHSIAVYLPVYAAWAAVVAFLFPFVFGFR